MEIKAKLNYLKIAPRKVRIVADLIRGAEVKEAKIQLRFAAKRASDSLLKLLNSSIANAKNNFNVEEGALFIKEIKVNEGPPFKRWRAGARGRAFPITKRTSRVDLILGVKEGIEVEKKKAVKKPEPIKAGVVEEEKTTIEKPKFKAPQKITKKPEPKGLFKKIFRRKSF